MPFKGYYHIMNLKAMKGEENVYQTVFILTRSYTYPAGLGRSQWGRKEKDNSIQEPYWKFAIDAYFDYWKSYGHGRSTRKEEHRRTAQ